MVGRIRKQRVNTTKRKAANPKMKNSIHQKNEVEPKAKFKSGKTRGNEAIRKPQDEKHSKRRHRETLGDTGGNHTGG